MLKLTNFKEAEARFANLIKQQAQQNLREPTRKLEVDATWVKSGNRWVVKTARKIRKAKKTSNTGKLVNSINYEVSEDGKTLTISTADYGKYVEEGRKPGLRGVPKRDLVQWLRKKGMDEGLYFQINRKIKKFGIPATEFLSKAIDEEMDESGDFLLDGLVEDFDEYFDEQMKKIKM